MKLKEFNTDNSKFVSDPKVPTLRFNGKAGLISLSYSLAELLKIKEEDRIIILQDEDNLKDWYISKTRNESGFALRRDSEKKSNTLNCSLIVKRIFNSIGFDGSSCSMKVSLEPVKYDNNELYLIITSSINSSSRTKE